MSWFRVDDKSWGHAKVVRVGNSAWGVFCRLGAYASDHLTDGIIPTGIVLLIAQQNDIDRLIDCDLLEQIDAEFFRLHDFLDYNPSAEEVGKLRESRAKAGKRGGKQTASKRQASAERLLPTRLKQTGTPSDPVPIPLLRLLMISPDLKLPPRARAKSKLRAKLHSRTPSPRCSPRPTPTRDRATA